MIWAIIASTIALVGSVSLGLRSWTSYAVATRVDIIELEHNGQLSNRYGHWLRPILEGVGALMMALFAGFFIGSGT